MDFLNKLEKKFGRYAIRDLMKYIAIGGFAVFLIDYIVFRGGVASSLLMFEPNLIMKGQIWRLITFIFIPPTNDVFFLLFALYFYYMIGNGLEQEWGSFKFNVYYLMGMVATVIAGFITNGIADVTYLNLSLFLAFAYIYPNYELLLFFILPIKIKYLAAIDVLILLSSFFRGGLTTKIVILAAILNFLLFFGKDMLSGVKTKNKVVKNKKKFKDNRPKIIYFHRCYVCGATEKTHPNMEFRYCAQCDGHHEYCMNHLFNHEHVKED